MNTGLRKTKSLSRSKTDKIFYSIKLRVTHLFSTKKYLHFFFLFLRVKHTCTLLYSLEVPCQDTSNEQTWYPQHMFPREIKKKKKKKKKKLKNPFLSGVLQKQNKHIYYLK